MKLSKLRELAIFLFILSHVCHDSFSVLKGSFFSKPSWQLQKMVLQTVLPSRCRLRATSNANMEAVKKMEQSRDTTCAVQPCADERLSNAESKKKSFSTLKSLDLETRLCFPSQEPQTQKTRMCFPSKIKEDMETHLNAHVFLITTQNNEGNAHVFPHSKQPVARKHAMCLKCVSYCTVILISFDEL